MVSKGRKSSRYVDISTIKQQDIAAHYLGVHCIPCLINSPLRQDKNPSFGLFSPDGKKVCYIDYSTKEHGSIIDVLMLLWKCSFEEALGKIAEEMEDITTVTPIEKGKYTIRTSSTMHSAINLKCKIREWQKHDIEYWGSYGISIKWLQYANVYPISHKIIIKNNDVFTYGADKYAYVYVEFKEGHTTLKIYQPFNSKFKWCNTHDGSVISLWTKIPAVGDKVCICSSLKDALCLWVNSNIPSIALQGEGYNISNTAIKELKSRFKHIYICFDNDKAGIYDANSLSVKTGFTNIVLPSFEGGKDISDYRKLYGKNQFNQLINTLFNNE